MNIEFELNKVKREIQMHGSLYEFKRNKLDDDLEPTGEVETITQSCGLFHMSKSYIKENVSEGSRTRTKGQPMLLMLYDDAQEIKNNDFLVINGNQYKVVEKNNIQECGLVVDISLEVILNGDN